MITHIPDCFGDSLPSLEHFDASFNKIQKPPPSMGNLLKLKYLDLNNNELLEVRKGFFLRKFYIKVTDGFGQVA